MKKVKKCKDEMGIVAISDGSTEWKILLGVRKSFASLCFRRLPGKWTENGPKCEKYEKGKRKIKSMASWPESEKSAITSL
jgi:hypothetical protein